MNKLCEVTGCHRSAKFSIRIIESGEWKDVCGTHDNHFGIENLIAQGCSNDEARQINKDVKNENNLLELYRDI